MIYSQNTANELRRSYDALMELCTGYSTSTQQAIEEYRSLYLQAFHAYSRGDLQNAELLARALKHLCRAAWYDAKIKFLESHSEDVPHVPGLPDEMYKNFDEVVIEIESRLARLKLTGLADRFGARSRKHIQCLFALDNKNSLLADSFLKAAYEYCLATEALHQIEFRAAAA